MATRQHRTDLLIRARTEGMGQAANAATKLVTEHAKSLDKQTRGFAEAEQKARRFTGSMGRMVKEIMDRDQAQRVEAYRNEIDDLDKSLQDLYQAQTVLARGMREVEQGSEAYEKLTGEMEKLDRQVAQGERNIRLMERAFKDEAKAIRETDQAIQQARGSFAQGFMQGGIGAPFMQRGPGMYQQAAGIMVGRGVRGALGAAAAGAAQVPFSGIGGIAQGLGGIPIVGGAMAGLLQTGAGYAGQALSFEQQMMMGAPFLGTMRGPGSAAVARARGSAAAGIAGQRVTPTPAEQARIDELYGMGALGGQASAEERFLLGAIREAPTDEMARELMARRDQAGARRRARIRDSVLAPRQAQADAETARQRREAGDLAEAELRAQSVRGRFLGGARRQGRRFGFDQAAMVQMLTQVAQAGGGGAADIMQQGLMGRAGAAARFGVGPEVVGAFLQAGRRGGLAGGQGRGGAALEEAMKNGVRLGLEGSELVEYMQQTAESIRQWRTSGIPLNEGSLARMCEEFSGVAGIGGLRGMGMARGLRQGMINLAGQGPTSPAQLMALQELGGYRGGGLEDFANALERLESGDFLEGGMERMIERLSGTAGGPAAGRLALRNLLRQLGVTAGLGEVRGMQERAGMTQAERMAAGPPIEAADPAGLRTRGLTGAAAARVSPLVQRQVDNTNKQLDAGRKLVDQVLTLEGATKKVVDSFATLAKGPLANVSKFADTSAEKLEAFSEALGDATSALDVLKAAGLLLPE